MAWHSGATESILSFPRHPARRRFQPPPSPVVVILAACLNTRLSTVSDLAFPVAGSRLWNSVLPDVTSDSTLTVFFRNRLKTQAYLFS